ncbi:nucleolar protein 10-like [Sycon ciliatum]|uniref:nucleolar protein 10-like n=1 Tax=Sycon ciliatum TaxID=27933 RepID=UPI0031F6423B
MQVVDVNDVKIYNLSSGKTLPDWISERKRRSMVKNDAGLQKRIQLLQEFEMPTASTKVRLSPDGQYILTAGVYKPRVRCYDVKELSQKFERCMSSEVVQFEILSEDYSKMVFLQCDRYVEFHTRNGFHYRTRIPKFGRDLAYHPSTCDLFLAGAGKEVYRLNLEQGQFLAPYVTDAAGINVCQINKHLDVVTLGTSEGRVLCWDPRCRKSVATLDLAKIPLIAEYAPPTLSPLEVSCITFKDENHMAIGTNWGQVCLFDLRASQPYLVKDHHQDLPIKQVDFFPREEFVLSSDSKHLKIWNENTGKLFSTVEPESPINDFAVFPDKGLILMANEATKNQVYFLPALGPAPVWCSFLDSLTEELEESPEPTVYDDYKFLTKTELENYGLDHLIGSNLVRQSLHGFFIDIRLYQKAKSLMQPFSYKDFHKKEISKKMETDRSSRLQLQKLPKVNRALAQRLADDDTGDKKKKKAGKVDDLSEDARFTSLFSDPSFQIDERSEEYMRNHPIVSKQQEKDRRKLQQLERLETGEGDEAMDGIDDEELEGRASEDESSDEDEEQIVNRRQLEKLRHQELAAKKQERNRRRQLAKAEQQRQEKLQSAGVSSRGQSTMSAADIARKQKMSSFGSRLRDVREDGDVIRSSLSDGGHGSKQITFAVKTAEEKLQEDKLRAHKRERREHARPAIGAARGRGRGRGGRGGFRGGFRGAPKWKRK